MTVLQIKDFGGEVPRVKPRALPPGAAQRYENLLATSNELRPLAGDKQVGLGAVGAKTLYRLSRNADGSLRTGDTAGWIAEMADKNHVKGQLNDDATERTVVTWNDGTQAPRVIDAKGADRLLGVPAPFALTVQANEVSQFTREDALAWVDEGLKPKLAEALFESIHEARTYDRESMAGPKSLYGWYSYPPSERCMAQLLTPERAKELGLDGPDVGAHSYLPSGLMPWPGDQTVPSGLVVALPLELLPYWGKVINKTALEDKLRLIESPNGGTQLWTDPQISTLADKLMALFDPDGDSLKSWRAKLDKAQKDFMAALYHHGIDDPGPRPVEPTKPSVPEYYIMDGG